MVYIDIERNDSNITLYCHKGSEQGETFKIVMDAATGEVLEKPDYPDIDASVAYGHVYSMLRHNKPLPTKTIAEWG